MNMELIQSAASDALVNVVLAVIALAGAYAVYYIRLGAAKLKDQTAQIKDEAGRKVLEDALDDVVNLATVSVGAMEQTTAKALRDAVKSGKASREELLALGKQVFDEVPQVLQAAQGPPRPDAQVPHGEERRRAGRAANGRLPGPLGQGGATHGL